MSECVSLWLLRQNAEDNEYAAGVQPTLELVLTTWDITGLGSSVTLLVFNNEIGFSKENIESLCSIGKSTKKGRRCQGFIGEKGSIFEVRTYSRILFLSFNLLLSSYPYPKTSLIAIGPLQLPCNY